MSMHQVIYTSSKRGIDSINDGQHIHSYDEGFKGKITDSVKSLFTYNVPNVTMTDEIVGDMPQSFIYRRLSGDTCAVALNTYLGRDYMGGSGRFGNIMSHVIVCDESGFNVYPCELYKSSTLQEQMDFDEVNSSQPPPFLPQPQLQRGSVIDIESVYDFLCDADNIETYKKMLGAMLNFETARKRLVINDTPENTVLWIAALHYALPLKLALHVSFTTYDHNPELSAGRICGVVSEATAYNAANAGAHFTFDFVNGIFPDIDTEDSFYDFIDTGMTISYDMVQAFHDFIIEKLDYTKPNERYLDLYTLYCLFNEDLDNIIQDRFAPAISVMDEFATDSAKNELLGKLAGEREYILSSNDDYMLEILKTIINRMDNAGSDVQRAARALIVDKTLNTFTSPGISEKVFLRMFGEIEALAEKSKISIPSELMKPENKQKLLADMEGNSELWRRSFIVDILCDYVVGQSMPADELYANKEMGQLIGSIITSMAASDLNDGILLFDRALNKLKGDWKLCLAITSTLETMIADASARQTFMNRAWAGFYQTAVKYQAADRMAIINCFAVNKRYEQAFTLFNELMKNAENLTQASTLFNEQFKTGNEDYISSKQPQICTVYYNYVKASREEYAQAEQRGILNIVLSKKIPVDFVDVIIADVLSGLPIDKPTAQSRELIRLILEYNFARNQPSQGRLLLIASADFIASAKDKTSLSEAFAYIRKLSQSEKIDLTKEQPKDSQTFIGFVSPRIYRFCKSADDLIMFFDEFSLTIGLARLFMEICAKESIESGKNDESFSRIIMLLQFLFRYRLNQANNDTAKLLKKLGKKRLKSLDIKVNEAFKGNRDYLTQWDEVLKATNDSGIFSKFFKR